MEEIKLEIKMDFAQMDELNDIEQQLIKRAIKATHNSYANYSHFYVGAALLLENGEIMIGANQENAAFPSGLCAERTAIFAAQANHPELKITTLAIAARNENGLLKSPITPCGACRQVILEIEDRYKSPVRILLYGTEGVYIIKSVKDLLPLCFVDENMHKK
jgi:cytidine deaminase